MTSRSDVKTHAGGGGHQRLYRSRISRGQAMVEFAFGAALTLALMLVGVQFAIIGQAALAVSQGSSALARYVAVNPGTFGTQNGTATLPSAASALLSPTINDANLTVTIASYQSDGVTEETGTIIPSQDQVKISLSYNATNKIFLPTHTLLGISFPTALSAAESQLYE
jgi:Flp pilus assembly protein TadG